jgi:ABC-type branched-subunit amino acid transport system substrate-binding protein
MKPHILSALAAALVSAAALSPMPALAQGCTTTIGMVVSLTGPAGRFGQAASKSAELAFRDINAAGGAAGCQLALDLRDAQSQGAVAVDQARQLVDLRRVPAIIGGIISSVSIPILTSVTADAGVVQVSPASSSPTLTRIAAEGRAKGVFLGRAAGCGGGEVRHRPEPARTRRHPRQQRFRRQHAGRVPPRL